MRRALRPEAALALGAGFLVALSMPPWGFWPLAFVGVALFGGVILLTWLVFQVGFALAGPAPFVPTMARTRSARPALHGAVGLGAVALVVVLAAVAPEGRDTGETIRVALVQGGGAQGTRAVNTDSREVVERHLAATRTIAAGEVDLVVWPENVVDIDDATFATSVELTEVAGEAARLRVPVAVGITEDVPGRPGRFLNAQVVVTPDGEVTSRYDKVHRVPFGEYVPMRDLLESLGVPVGQVPSDAVAGTTPAVLDLPDGRRIAIVISWEVFFGDRARDGVSNGGALILNPTNGSSYTGTILQTQQIASSRLRAVETGRWVAQVAPTGLSAFVSPDGTVHDRTGVSEQAVLVRDLALREGRTWYTAMGDWPVEILLGGLLALSLVVPARARRALTRATGPRPPG